MKNKIYICIPIHNRIELTINCLRSIYKQGYKNFQVIICDDGSTDNSSEIVKREYSDTIILQGNGNLWWTGAINKCISKAISMADDNDFILTLNNDTELLDDTLNLLAIQSIKNNYSIIAALNIFYNRRNKIERSAFIQTKFTKRFKSVTKWGEAKNNRTGLIPIDMASGKGVLIPIFIYKKIGIYDQEKLPHYHADTEFIFRAKRNGYNIYLSFDAEVLSHQDLSGIGTITSKPNLKEFFKSFFVIKSTHHFKSLQNYYQLLYGKLGFFYLCVALIFIFLGFLKRVLQYRFRSVC